jgi:hypothetical protein
LWKLYLSDLYSGLHNVGKYYTLLTKNYSPWWPGTWDFNTTFPSFICYVERSQGTKFKILKDFTLALVYYTWMKNMKNLCYIYLHLNVLISSHTSKESEVCHFSYLQKCVLFRNIHNTFCNLQYHCCHSTILHGSHSYETKRPKLLTKGVIIIYAKK